MHPWNHFLTRLTAAMEGSDAVSVLQQTSTTDGESAFDYLTRIVSTIYQQKPSDPVDLVESSILAKRTKETDGEVRAAPVPSQAAHGIAKAELFKAPTGDEEQARASGPECHRRWWG